MLLAGLGPLLAFSAGAYFPRSWLPALLFVAVLTLVTLALAPRMIMKASTALLLATFSLQVLWTGFSLIWADSTVNAWEELNRSVLFGLTLLLSVVAVGFLRRRAAFWLALAVLAGVVIVAAGCVFRLATFEDTIRLFTGGRLHYPVTYWNGLAALLMVGFWLALGLASARNLPRWVPPILVAFAAVLAELALLPESRGALWAFVLVAPWFVVLSPHRFRALFHLGLVLLAAGLSWGRLTGVFTAASQNEELKGAVEQALFALLLSGLLVAAAAAAIQLAEARLHRPSRRLVSVISVTLLVFSVIAGGFALAQANRQLEGGISGFAGRTWDQFVSDEPPRAVAERGHRFSEVGLNGRLRQWRTAWQAFEERPLLGLGAQNFEPYYYQHRTSDLQVKQPHSQPMQLLAELGLPGALLWLLFVAGALARGLWARFHLRRPENQAAAAALLLGSLSWFIHSSADWLWQLAGVTWPAILLLGGLAAMPVRDGETSEQAAEAAAAPTPETAAATTEVAPDRPADRPPDRGATDRPSADSRRRTAPAVGAPAPGLFLALRIAGITVTLLVLVSALLPYLSLRYNELSYGLAGSDAVASLDAAERAAWLDPTSPEPLVTRAYVLATEAGEADRGTADPSARRQLLGLRLLALEKARSRDPVSWSLALQTGEATLEYREAKQVKAAPPPNQGNAEQPAPTSIILEQEEDELAALRSLEQQDLEQLTARARTHLEDAQRLNPRQPEIQERLTALRQAMVR